MNRQQKEQVIESLKSDFQNNPSSFVVGVKGLTVTQLEALRSGLREKGGKLKVAKVRFAKQAITGLDHLKELDPMLKEQLGFIFTDQQAPAVAKVLRDFSKENKALELVAGYFEDSVLSKDNILEIASLPSRDELLAMIARVLNEPMAMFARAVQAVADKKAEGGDAPADDAEAAPKEEDKPAEPASEAPAESASKEEEKSEEAKSEENKS
ncbi:MAG TPA: 50S ribosomal protein L10 [Candidatus Babeliales bacterium]|nr:50S ribosomal protein L10 [Candidatus Babeliales bacterium]